MYFKIYQIFIIILFFSFNLIAKDLSLQTFNELKTELTNNKITIDQFSEKIDEFDITSDIFEISRKLFLDDALSLEDYLEVIENALINETPLIQKNEGSNEIESVTSVMNGEYIFQTEITNLSQYIVGDLNYGELFNTVRVGMLAYGVPPSDEVPMEINVEPVMSFCGPIVNLRKVSRNTPISYGGIYLTKKVTNIAVVQMGFADGVPRSWYENGYVSHNGKYYKIAGRICMDQFMVDFGNVEPKIGDEVLVFGKRKNDSIPIETIAKEINSTTYVILTGIHGRTEYILT